MKDGEWFILSGYIEFNFPNIKKQIRWESGMMDKMCGFYRNIFDHSQAWEFVQPFYG